MVSLDNIFLFILIFSSISLIRLIFLFLISVFHNPPKKIEIKKYETFYYIFLISYIITFIINKN